MKLHLPKRLLTALLAAFTAISLTTAPTVLTLGAVAWGGWGTTTGQWSDENTYYLDGDDKIKVGEGKATSSVPNTVFVKSNSTEDVATTVTSLTFDSDVNKKVIVTGDWNGNYNLTNLTITNVCVNVSGTNLEIGGNQAANHKQVVNINQISGSETLGTLTIQANSILTLGAEDNTSNTFTLSSITNSGTLTVNGPVNFTDSYAISHGAATSKISFYNAGTITIDANHKVTGTGTLVVGGGTTLTMSGSSGGDSVIRGNIEVLGNGKLVVYGGDTTGYNGSQTSKITLRGESATSLATMQMAADGGSNNTAEAGRQTFQTNLELQGNTLVTGGSLETFGGTITATGVNNEIASTIYVRSNAEFAVTNADDILTISGQIGWRSDNKGTFTKSGAGELKLTNANNHFYNNFTQTGGKTTITGASSTFDGNLSITGGSMSLQGAASVAGQISVSSGASLDISGNLTISESIANSGSLSLDSIEIHISSPLDSLVSAQENGVWTKEEFYLVTGNGATVTDSVVIVNGNTYSINAQTGTFSRDIEGTYFVIHSGTEMTSTESTTHVYDVRTNGTLIIDSGSESEAGNILTSAVGAGNIILSTDATLDSSSQISGGLTIRDASLTAGTSKTDSVNISSFSSITLDGATLNYGGGSTTLGSTTVTANGALLHIADMPGDAGTTSSIVSINGLQLAGDLDISTLWKSKISISALTGTGDLNIGKSSYDKQVNVSINSLQNYSGTISATGTNSTGDLNTVLSLSAGGTTMNLGGLALYNKAKATVSVYGNSSTGLGDVILDKGATLDVYAGTGTGSKVYTITLNSLTVQDSGKLSFLNQGGGWQGTININTLIGTNATLHLDSNCNTSYQSVFNLNGGFGSDFSGIITLKASDQGSNRKTALNINNYTVAQNAVITLDGAGTTDESVSLALGTASVAVRGVNDTSATGPRYILSGARNMADDNQNSDTIRRTLIIATQQDDVFTTAATVKNNINLVKTGEGSQAFTGDMSQFNGLIDVQEGTLIIGKDNIQTALGLGGTIRNEGNLILNTNLKASSADVFDITAINGVSLSDYSNGYIANAEVTYALVSGSGTTTFRNGAVIYLGSDTTGVDINTENGTFVGSSAGTYFILSDEVLSSVAASDTSDTLSKFYIGSNGLLKYDGGSFSNVKLTGNGVFNAGNAYTMPSGLSLSDGWTGTVQISGTHNTSILLNELGRLGSTVEITAGDISGYFQNADLTFNPNLKLTGNLTLRNGYSNADYIFAGTISGAGNLDIARSGGSPNSFTFTNSIAGWTGELIHSSGQTDTIIFKEAADIINAKINRTGGTLNITVENVATFNNTVSASTITVNNSATFNAATSADAIVGTGDIIITGASGALTQNGNSNKTISPIITLTNGGSLKLSTSGDNRTTTLAYLNVSGSGKLENATHTNGWQTRLNLGELNSITPGATLNITSSANTSQRVIIDINGGSYNGLINISSSTKGTERKLALNINDADVAADAVIALHGNGNEVALGIGNSEVWVKGIENQANADGTMKIVSGQQAYNTAENFASDTRAARTLVIDTDGSDNAAGGNYTTSATLGSHINLKKLGTGSQTFSGTVSDFNGSIDVQEGTLAFTGSSGPAFTQASVADGAELILHSLTSVSGKIEGTGTLNLALGSTVEGIPTSVFAGHINTVKLTSSTCLDITGSAQKEEFANILNIVVEAGSTFRNRVTGAELGTSNNTLTIAGSGISGEAQKNAALMFGPTGNSGTMTMHHKVYLSADATVGVVGSDRIGVLTGTVDGNGHVLTKIGAGELRLNGTVTRADLKVSEGTLTINGTATGSESVVVNGGTLKLGATTSSMQVGDTATITKAKVGNAASMEKVQLSEEGISSADETGDTKGTVSDAMVTLAALAEGTSFSIEDVTLLNVNIEAANAGDRVNLSNVDATTVQLTKGEFHMLDKAQVGTGGTDINLPEGEPVNLNFTTSLMEGMTLGTDASLVVDLGNLSGFTDMSSGKPTFSITLAGFSIEGFNIGDFLSKNPGIYFAADSWLGQLLLAQGASEYVKGDTLEAGTQATAGTGSGVGVSYTSTAAGTVIIISGLQVPEPTTTSLSLLALSALAMRRRRK